MKLKSALFKTIALTTLLSFTFTSTIAYSDIPSATAFFQKAASYLKSRSFRNLNPAIVRSELRTSALANQASRISILKKDVERLSRFLKKYNGKALTADEFLKDFSIARYRRRTDKRQFIFRALSDERLREQSETFSPAAIRLIARLQAAGYLGSFESRRKPDPQNPRIGDLFFADELNGHGFLLLVYHPVSGDWYNIRVVPNETQAEKASRFQFFTQYETGFVFVGSAEGTFKTGDLKTIGDVPEEVQKFVRLIQKNISFYTKEKPFSKKIATGGSLSESYFLEFDDENKKTIKITIHASSFEGNLSLQMQDGNRAAVSLSSVFQGSVVGKTSELELTNLGREFLWRNFYRDEDVTFRGDLATVFSALERSGGLGDRILELGDGGNPLSAVMYPKKKIVALALRPPKDIEQKGNVLTVRADVERIESMSPEDRHAIDLVLREGKPSSQLSPPHLYSQFDTIVISNLLNYVDAQKVAGEVLANMSPGASVVVQNSVLLYATKSSLNPRGVKTNAELVNLFRRRNIDVQVFGLPLSRSASWEKYGIDGPLRELTLKEAATEFEGVLYLVARRKAAKNVKPLLLRRLSLPEAGKVLAGASGFLKTARRSELRMNELGQPLFYPTAEKMAQKMFDHFDIPQDAAHKILLDNTIYFLKQIQKSIHRSLTDDDFDFFMKIMSMEDQLFQLSKDLAKPDLESGASENYIQINSEIEQLIRSWNKEKSPRLRVLPADLRLFEEINGVSFVHNMLHRLYFHLTHPYTNLEHFQNSILLVDELKKALDFVRAKESYSESDLYPRVYLFGSLRHALGIGDLDVRIWREIGITHVKDASFNSNLIDLYFRPEKGGEDAFAFDPVLFGNNGLNFVYFFHLTKLLQLYFSGALSTRLAGQLAISKLKHENFNLSQIPDGERYRFGNWFAQLDIQYYVQSMVPKPLQAIADDARKRNAELIQWREQFREIQHDLSDKWIRSELRSLMWPVVVASTVGFLSLHVFHQISSRRVSKPWPTELLEKFGIEDYKDLRGRILRQANGYLAQMIFQYHYYLNFDTFWPEVVRSLPMFSDFEYIYDELERVIQFSERAYLENLPEARLFLQKLGEFAAVMAFSAKHFDDEVPVYLNSNDPKLRRLPVLDLASGTNAVNFFKQISGDDHFIFSDRSFFVEAFSKRAKKFLRLGDQIEIRRVDIRDPALLFQEPAYRHVRFGNIDRYVDSLSQEWFRQLIARIPEGGQITFEYPFDELEFDFDGAGDSILKAFREFIHPEEWQSSTGSRAIPAFYKSGRYWHYLVFTRIATNQTTPRSELRASTEVVRLETIDPTRLNHKLHGKIEFIAQNQLSSKNGSVLKLEGESRDPRIIQIWTHLGFRPLVPEKEIADTIIGVANDFSSHTRIIVDHSGKPSTIQINFKKEIELNGKKLRSISLFLDSGKSHLPFHLIPARGKELDATPSKLNSLRSAIESGVLHVAEVVYGLPTAQSRDHLLTKLFGHTEYQNVLHDDETTAAKRADALGKVQQIKRDWRNNEQRLDEERRQAERPGEIEKLILRLPNEEPFVFHGPWEKPFVLLPENGKSGYAALETKRGQVIQFEFGPEDSDHHIVSLAKQALNNLLERQKRLKHAKRQILKKRIVWASVFGSVLSMIAALFYYFPVVRWFKRDLQYRLFEDPAPQVPYDPVDLSIGFSKLDQFALRVPPGNSEKMDRLAEELRFILDQDLKYAETEEDRNLIREFISLISKGSRLAIGNEVTLNGRSLLKPFEIVLMKAPQSKDEPNSALAAIDYDYTAWLPRKFRLMNIRYFINVAKFIHYPEKTNNPRAVQFKKYRQIHRNNISLAIQPDGSYRFDQDLNRKMILKGETFYESAQKDPSMKRLLDYYQDPKMKDWFRRYVVYATQPHYEQFVVLAEAVLKEIGPPGNFDDYIQSFSDEERREAVANELKNLRHIMRPDGSLDKRKIRLAALFQAWLDEINGNREIENPLSLTFLLSGRPEVDFSIFTEDFGFKTPEAEKDFSWLFEYADPMLEAFDAEHARSFKLTAEFDNQKQPAERSELRTKSGDIGNSGWSKLEIDLAEMGQRLFEIEELLTQRLVKQKDSVMMRLGNNDAKKAVKDFFDYVVGQVDLEHGAYPPLFYLVHNRRFDQLLTQAISAAGTYHYISVADGFRSELETIQTELARTPEKLNTYFQTDIFHELVSLAMRFHYSERNGQPLDPMDKLIAAAAKYLLAGMRQYQGRFIHLAIRQFQVGQLLKQMIIDPAFKEDDIGFIKIKRVQKTNTVEIYYLDSDAQRDVIKSEKFKLEKQDAFYFLTLLQFFTQQIDINRGNVDQIGSFILADPKNPNRKLIFKVEALANEINDLSIEVSNYKKRNNAQNGSAGGQRSELRALSQLLIEMGKRSDELKKFLEEDFREGLDPIEIINPDDPETENKVGLTMDQEGQFLRAVGKMRYLTASGLAYDEVRSLLEDAKNLFEDFRDKSPLFRQLGHLLTLLVLSEVDADELLDPGKFHGLLERFDKLDMKRLTQSRTMTERERLELKGAQFALWIMNRDQGRFLLSIASNHETPLPYSKLVQSYVLKPVFKLKQAKSVRLIRNGAVVTVIVSKDSDSKISARHFTAKPAGNALHFFTLVKLIAKDVAIERQRAGSDYGTFVLNDASESLEFKVRVIPTKNPAQEEVLITIENRSELRGHEDGRLNDVIPEPDGLLLKKLLSFADNDQVFLDNAAALAQKSAQGAALLFGILGPHLRHDHRIGTDELDIQLMPILIKGFLPSLKEFLKDPVQNRQKILEYGSALINGLLFVPNKTAASHGAEFFKQNDFPVDAFGLEAYREILQDISENLDNDPSQDFLSIVRQIAALFPEVFLGPEIPIFLRHQGEAQGEIDAEQLADFNKQNQTNFTLWQYVTGQASEYYRRVAEKEEKFTESYEHEFQKIYTYLVKGDGAKSELRFDHLNPFDGLEMHIETMESSVREAARQIDADPGLFLTPELRNYLNRTFEISGDSNQDLHLKRGVILMDILTREAGTVTPLLVRYYKAQGYEVAVVSDGAAAVSFQADERMKVFQYPDQAAHYLKKKLQVGFIQALGLKEDRGIALAMKNRGVIDDESSADDIRGLFNIVKFSSELRAEFQNAHELIIKA